MLLKQFFPAALLALALAGGCKRTPLSSPEYAYVSAPQIFLRDRISAVYNKIGTLTNGERVVVLQHDRRFVKVRTSQGVEGWVEQRSLADQSVYDQLDALSKKFGSAPAQAHATARNDVNMHVTPARDSDKLFQIKENEKLELLQRAVTNKNAVVHAAPAVRRTPKPSKAQLKEVAKKKGVELPPPPPAPSVPAIAYERFEPQPEAPKPAADPGPPEDWWLVRDSHGRAGWVLGRMLEVDVPLEIAQYAEGKRIVGAFVLTTVEDDATDRPNHQVPYYLVLTNEPHDGQQQDYDGIRIFTWNTKRHRYETAYREHDLNGYLPVSVATGSAPAFAIHVKNADGTMAEKKYHMEGVLVKRDYAAGEQPAPRLVRARHHRR